MASVAPTHNEIEDDQRFSDHSKNILQRISFTGSMNISKTNSVLTNYCLEVLVCQLFFV